MIGGGLSVDAAGNVIRWNVVAMFAPSFLTGFLIKRFCAERVAMAGLSLLALAAAVALSGLSVDHSYISLAVLGVRWNFGLIGATSMLATTVPVHVTAMVQGANNTIIALVSAICAFAAGVIVASLEWPVLAGIAMISLPGAMAAFVFSLSAASLRARWVSRVKCMR